LLYQPVFTNKTNLFQKGHPFSTGIKSVSTKFNQKVFVHVLFPRKGDANIQNRPRTIKKYSKNRFGDKNLGADVAYGWVKQDK